MQKVTQSWFVTQNVVWSLEPRMVRDESLIEYEYLFRKPQSAMNIRIENISKVNDPSNAWPSIFTLILVGLYYWTLLILIES